MTIWNCDNIIFKNVSYASYVKLRQFLKISKLLDTSVKYETYLAFKVLNIAIAIDLKQIPIEFLK